MIKSLIKIITKNVTRGVTMGEKVLRRPGFGMGLAETNVVLWAELFFCPDRIFWAGWAAFRGQNGTTERGLRN
jgi:hypothetical protein